MLSDEIEYVGPAEAEKVGQRFGRLMVQEEADTEGDELGQVELESDWSSGKGLTARPDIPSGSSRLAPPIRRLQLH